MSSRPHRYGKALSLLIVWSLALGGLVAAIVAFSPAAHAGSCDQVGGVITGDWTVSNVQVCAGIVYTVDGTININAGGSLTLIDGGLVFAKDASHAGYALNVNGDGELVLDHSIVSTQTVAIAPVLKLPLTVTGPNARFTMRNGAMLKFPGWFNTTSATINITDSTITGFTDTEIGNLGVDLDDNDDAPQIAWDTTTASLYRSRVERLYEYVSGGGFTGNGNITLTSSSNLYAYDTYLGVDYSDLVGRHNMVRVDGTSNAYLYNVTIDRTQDPSSMTNWRPAYVPTAVGGSVYLLRWLHVTVLDSTAFPVSGATISPTFSPSASPAQYPDNGLGTTPSSRTLWYLGRAASGTNAWNVADPTGQAVIPLYTDQVTTASLPNAESFGNYEIVATFSTSSTSGGASFPPYPSIDDGDNNKWLTLSFGDLQVRTLPDLELRQAEYAGTMSVTLNRSFTVYARIYNRGQTTATNVAVAAYLDGSRSAQVARASGLTIVSFLNQSLTVSGISVIGAHTLMLVADPDNTIDEGGAAQEANNFANITLDVLPPPEGFVAIQSPPAGQTVEPGSGLSVTGYVRDLDSKGIIGVPLTIELRSGTSLIANTTTVSGTSGFFAGTIQVPSSTADGSYSVVVTPTSGGISGETRAVTVQKGGSFLFQPVPFLGIQWWLILVIIAAAAGIIIGVSVYLKFYGLGRMVECGECGAFIPEDATRCPKCGVEFEKDMAKCSNCQAWIPVDLKECPECGVQFATGEVEMADYQEKMRLHYDEVVQKFKAEASRQLGRTLSESEFQEWWRKQPTFVTFEDWLREEEEMRKMGSKPCPVCGTLNSVTATVCHKCGSLMREPPRPPSGGGGGGGAVVVGAPRSPAAPPPGAPVVQKRVIRRPVESQEGGAAEAKSESSEEKPSEEDL